MLTDAERHDLYEGFLEILGERRAKLMMKTVPPVAWTDVATKADLQRLEDGLGGRIDSVGDRLRAEFYDRMEQQTRTLLIALVSTLVGAIFVVSLIAFGAAQLA